MFLYCVRHGETLFNAQGRIQGQLDTELSPLGKRQAEAVAAALAREPIDAIYSSPLRRAYETAEAIARHHRLPIRTDDRLKEIHAGIFQGLLRAELDERHPQEAQRWHAKDPDFCIPGGESRRALMTRGATALRAVRAQEHRAAIIVAHGALLSASLKELLGVPPDRNPFHFYNAAYCRLLWQNEVVLDYFNRQDHLHGLNSGGYGDL